MALCTTLAAAFGQYALALASSTNALISKPLSQRGLLLLTLKFSTAILALPHYKP